MTHSGNVSGPSEAGDTMNSNGILSLFALGTGNLSQINVQSSAKGTSWEVLCEEPVPSLFLFFHMELALNSQHSCSVS